MCACEYEPSSCGMIHTPTPTTKKKTLPNARTIARDAEAVHHQLQLLEGGAQGVMGLARHRPLGLGLRQPTAVDGRLCGLGCVSGCGWW